MLNLIIIKNQSIIKHINTTVPLYVLLEILLRVTST